MDELDLLATARPVTPPTAETTAAARQRLFDLMDAAPAAAPAVTVPRRRIRAFRWGLVPAMAAALALVVVLTSSWGRPDDPVRPDVDLADAGPRPPQKLRNLLLAAADRTMGDSTAGGRYWVSEVESGTLLEVGRDGNRYAIMGRTEETVWHTVRRDDRAVHYFRWVGAAPASDADRAAWKRAGSPASWPKDEACPDSGSYPAGAGATRTVISKPGASTFSIGGGYITAAQVRDLPTDPVRLEAWLVDSLRRGNPDLTAAELSKGIFSSMLNLLYQAPGTPEVRAAAYRLLAVLPGLRDLGPVTDPKGRPGNAVTLVTNEDEPGVRQADTGGAREVRLIFDPESGVPLAWETRVLRPADYLSWVPAGAVFDYEAVLRTRWTDDVPPDTAGALPEDVQEPAGC
ncbi:hypothetical protein Ait01nite_057780 [Actinoplanes italicus]|uniref:CU044_5270 family protein n=1 Tax=Actinoplanes italicus TaxID=113567 RepID=A0A2T0K5T7_9ACTN|nr:CU044_5270 family protein [Actinoplanes italicus]PRX18325.1 hypothetical protein CLV67_113159 [Actinoplanes italicus]GIE32733.1 hypothetical protein Ait01nite_057780 [Actinoplanes italicus]